MASNLASPRGLSASKWSLAEDSLRLAPADRSQGSVFPSRGAALHGSGLCQPCAWFWKPGGCLNGVDCRRCHLCPEGELKRRRKAKDAAIREARMQEALGGRASRGSVAPKSTTVADLVEVEPATLGPLPPAPPQSIPAPCTRLSIFCP